MAPKKSLIKSFPKEDKDPPKKPPQYPQISIPNVMMLNGKSMPALGYGTWLGLDDNTNFLVEDIPKLVDALSYALEVGYRHIDTAHLYRVEPEIGDVIQDKMSAKLFTREELFVTTKVWQHMHRPEDVIKSIKASLKRLKLDYLDLVLMHWPMSIDVEGNDEKIDYLESWKGFEQAQREGLTRAIGVSNFSEDQLRRLLANCRLRPSCLQVELNLTLGQPDLVDYCKSQNIVVVGYSPFGTMVPSRDVVNSPPPKLDDPVMTRIAKKHNKTVTQVTLRYLYQRGIVSIPKTVTRARVVENASIFSFELDGADCADIALFDVDYRSVRPVFWQDYLNYPFDKVELDHPIEIPLSLRSWKNGANQDIE